MQTAMGHTKREAIGNLSADDCGKGTTDVWSHRISLTTCRKSSG